MRIGRSRALKLLNQQTAGANGRRSRKFRVLHGYFAYWSRAPGIPAGFSRCSKTKEGASHGLSPDFSVDSQGMVGEAGLEPATPGLEGRCSIQLSYSPAYSHSIVDRPQSASVNLLSAACST